MSGKKAGLMCGATGLGGAPIGKPTANKQWNYVSMINKITKLTSWHRKIRPHHRRDWRGWL